MAKSKVDQYKVWVKKAEEAEKRINKNDLRWLDKGRQAKNILKQIGMWQDELLNVVADVFNVFDVQEADEIVDQIVNASKEYIRQRIAEKTSKSAPSDAKNESKVGTKVAPTSTSSVPQTDAPAASNSDTASAQNSSYNVPNSTPNSNNYKIENLNTGGPIQYDAM